MATPFEDNVNAELPKRPWIDVPLSGALETGKALVATGIGMQLTQVDFPTPGSSNAVLYNPAMVRWIGNEPGDYAYSDIQAALDSLPSGADDLSSVSPYSNRTYIIYIRPDLTSSLDLFPVFLPAGLIIPDVRNIAFVGYNDQNVVCLIGKANVFLVDADFFMKKTAGTSTTGRVYFQNLLFRSITLNSTTWTSSRFDFLLLETQADTSSFYVTFDNSYIVIGLTENAGDNKTVGILNIQNTGNSESFYFYPTLKNNATLSLSIGRSPLLADCYIINTPDVCRSILSGLADNTLKTFRFDTGGGNAPVVNLLRLYLSDLATKVRNVIFSIEYQKIDATPVFDSILFWDLAVYSTGIYTSLVCEECQFLCFSTTTGMYHNMDAAMFIRAVPRISSTGMFQRIYDVWIQNVFTQVGWYGIPTGLPTLVYGRGLRLVQIAGGNINSMRIDTDPGSRTLLNCSPSNTEFLSSNIIRDEASIARIEKRAGMNIQVTPIAPSEPRLGDFWIETTEQF